MTATMAMRRFLKTLQTFTRSPHMPPHSWLTAAFRASIFGGEACRPWTQCAARRRSPRFG
ncbi:Hypothetical protein FKW44_022858, partial [Caligus rogercresseyi]